MRREYALTASVLIVGVTAIFLLPPVFDADGQTNYRYLLLRIATSYTFGIAVCFCFALVLGRRRR